MRRDINLKFPCGSAPVCGIRLLTLLLFSPSSMGFLVFDFSQLHFIQCVLFIGKHPSVTLDKSLPLADVWCFGYKMADYGNEAAVSPQCYFWEQKEHGQPSSKAQSRNPALILVKKCHLFLAEPSWELQQPVFNVVTLMNSENESSVKKAWWKVLEFQIR